MQIGATLPVCSDWSGGWGSEEMKEGVRNERILVQGPMMTYQNGRSRVHLLVCAWVKKKSNKMKGNRIWKLRDVHSTLASPLLLSRPLVPFLCSEGSTQPLKSPPVQDADIHWALFLNEVTSCIDSRRTQEGAAGQWIFIVLAITPNLSYETRNLSYWRMTSPPHSQIHPLFYAILSLPDKCKVHTLTDLHRMTDLREVLSQKNLWTGWIGLLASLQICHACSSSCHPGSSPLQDSFWPPSVLILPLPLPQLLSRPCFMTNTGVVGKSIRCGIADTLGTHLC